MAVSYKTMQKHKTLDEYTSEKNEVSEEEEE